MNRSISVRVGFESENIGFALVFNTKGKKGTHGGATEDTGKCAEHTIISVATRGGEAETCKNEAAVFPACETRVTIPRSVVPRVSHARTYPVV